MRKAAFFFLFISFFSSLFADTVLLKGGRRFENARARLGQGEIEIEAEDGRIYVFPADSLKEITYSPVKQNALQEHENRDHQQNSSQDHRENKEPQQNHAQSIQPTSTSTSTSEEKKQAATSACGFGKPFLEGLIPLWSPHYCQGRYGIGVLFTSLETISLYFFLKWHSQAYAQINDPLFFYSSVLIASTQTSPPNTAPTVAAMLYLSSQRYYSPPGGRQTISRGELEWHRQRSSLFLIEALLLDGITAWFLERRQTVAGSESSGSMVLVLPSIAPDEKGLRIRLMMLL